MSEPSLYIPGYIHSKKRPSTVSYKLCSTSPTDEKSFSLRGDAGKVQSSQILLMVIFSLQLSRNNFFLNSFTLISYLFNKLILCMQRFTYESSHFILILTYLHLIVKKLNKDDWCKRLLTIFRLNISFGNLKRRNTCLF